MLDILCQIAEKMPLAYSQVSLCRHLAITDSPIIRTAVQRVSAIKGVVCNNKNRKPFEIEPFTALYRTLSCGVVSKGILKITCICMHWLIIQDIVKFVTEKKPITAKDLQMKVFFTWFILLNNDL